MRAEPPFANAFTCSTVAIVVSSGKVVSNAPLAAVTTTGGTRLLSRSAPMCAFIPNYHGLPVRVWGKERGPGGGSAAIVMADGHLYFRYEDSVMALIEATPKGYNLKSSFTLVSKNGKSWPPPVIHNGKLYLRDHDNLLCYDVKAKR